MTSWDDVQAARDKADRYAEGAKDPIEMALRVVCAVLAIQAEMRALELTLDMKLTAYPDSEATLGFGG